MHLINNIVLLENFRQIHCTIFGDHLLRLTNQDTGENISKRLPYLVGNFSIEALVKIASQRKYKKILLLDNAILLSPELRKRSKLQEIWRIPDNGCLYEDRVQEYGSKTSNCITSSQSSQSTSHAIPSTQSSQSTSHGIPSSQSSQSTSHGIPSSQSSNSTTKKSVLSNFKINYQAPKPNRAYSTALETSGSQQTLNKIQNEI
ncbi:hypothetical protein ACTFIW_012057 [Dictyostelium discoideum]